jgi:hypothetical protein
MQTPRESSGWVQGVEISCFIAKKNFMLNIEHTD